MGFDNLIEVVALYNDCLENNNQAACDALNQIVDEDDDDSGGLSTGAWIGIGVGGGVLVLAGIALILSSSRASNSPRTRNTNTARGKGVREVDYAFEHGDEDMTISTDNESAGGRTEKKEEMLVNKPHRDENERGRRGREG